MPDPEPTSKPESAEQPPDEGLSSSVLFSDRLARDLLKFFRQRKGFGHWWDTIDEDIQGEILDELSDRLALELQRFNSEKLERPILSDAATCSEVELFIARNVNSGTIRLRLDIDGETIVLDIPAESFAHALTGLHITDAKVITRRYQKSQNV